MKDTIKISKAIDSKKIQVEKSLPEQIHLNHASARTMGNFGSYAEGAGVGDRQQQP